MLTHSTSGGTSTLDLSKNAFALNISVRFAYLLKTKEMIAIPARATPVKNLMMTNIMYDVENALRTANNMDPR